MDLELDFSRQILLPMHLQMLKLRERLTDQARALRRWADARDMNAPFTQVLVQEYLYKADAIESATRQMRHGKVME